VPPTLKNRLKQKNQNMKTLTKFVLAVTMLTAISANAQSLNSFGYSGSNRGYAYRNPYAAMPSVTVHSYLRHDGTYVPSHFRTAPNWTATDNLSYRGYGTIRVPRGLSGW
jgi:hypothetical protein